MAGGMRALGIYSCRGPGLVTAPTWYLTTTCNSIAREKQEDFKFKASLGNIVNLRLKKKKTFEMAAENVKASTKPF